VFQSARFFRLIRLGVFGLGFRVVFVHWLATLELYGHCWLSSTLKANLELGKRLFVVFASAHLNFSFQLFE
jgi:hypothetical protein